VFETAMQPPTPQCTLLDPCSTTPPPRQPRLRQRHTRRHALIFANAEVGFEMYYYWRARFDEFSKATATRQEARPDSRSTEHTRVSTTWRARALAGFSSTAVKRRRDAAAASSDSGAPGG